MKTGNVNDILVSIIVPVYNVRNYLENCIDSIIKQTYRNLEILLIDDGSSDGSGEVCDMYQGRDKRIRVIHKKNQGVAAARNQGIEESKGEYIAFVDADDYIDIEYIYKLLTTAIQNRAEVALCYYAELKQGTLYCKDDLLKEIYDVELDDFYSTWLIRYFRIGDSTLLWGVCYRSIIKRDVLIKDEIRFPLCKYQEDLVFMISLLKRCRRVACIQEYLYVYNIRLGSALTSYKKNLLEDHLLLLERLKTEINELSIEEGKKSLIMKHQYMDMLDDLLNNSLYAATLQDVRKELRDMRASVFGNFKELEEQFLVEWYMKNRKRRRQYFKLYKMHMLWIVAVLIRIKRMIKCS